MKRNGYSGRSGLGARKRRPRNLHLSWPGRSAARAREAAPETKPFVHRGWLRLGILGLLAAGAVYLSMVSVNVLVLGTDDVDYSQRTDTIMLLHWRPLPRRLAVLSVPRDTLIELPKRGPLKLNAVYAYGKALNGPAYALAMTRSSVENLLGARIHHWVHIRYSDVITLVDAVGGVPVYIPKQMRYSDQAGGVFIDLEPGYQLLDGRQALNYVRFRHDAEGDLGRMRRQQEFVKAFAAQMTGLSRLPRTAKAFRAFLRQVETDVNLPAALFLALEAKGIAGMNWRRAILPGRPFFLEGKAYWKTDPGEIRRMMAELGRPAKPRRKSADAAPTVVPEATPLPEAVAQAASRPEATAQATAEPAPAPAAVPEADRPRSAERARLPVRLPAGRQPVVRILNGCGVNGVCKRAAEPLRRRGMRILEADVTNAPHFNFSRTLIKTNRKNQAWAKSIAGILELSEDRIQTVPERISYPTVTVVVGRDFKDWLR